MVLKTTVGCSWGALLLGLVGCSGEEFCEENRTCTPLIENKSPDAANAGNDRDASSNQPSASTEPNDEGSTSAGADAGSSDSPNGSVGADSHGGSGDAGSVADAGDARASTDVGSEAAVDPCAECSPVADCDASGDASTRCTCAQGYEGDGLVCTRNLCLPLAGEADPCGENTLCEVVGEAPACACKEHFDSCDQQPGCEANLRTDAAHCGECGFACAGDLKCRSKTCDRAAEDLAIGFYVGCARRPGTAANDDGTMVCWGRNAADLLRDSSLSGDDVRSEAKEVEGIGNVRAIAANQITACALSADADTVRCWGQNTYDQLGQSPVDGVHTTTVSGAAALAANFTTTCALTNKGAVSCWGGNANGQLGRGSTGASTPYPAGVAPLNDAAHVVGDGYTFCARTKGAGRVLCWGGDYGSAPRALTTPVGQPLSLMTSVAIGASSPLDPKVHVCAVSAAGTVFCEGANAFGQLGRGTFGAGAEASTVIEDLSAVTEVVAGYGHTCALHEDSTVSCWGMNEFGQLGLGAGVGTTNGPNGTRIVTRPQRIDGLDGVVDLAAGGWNTCARLDTGQVQCWGNNDNGVVGDGTQIERATPANVAALP